MRYNLSVGFTNFVGNLSPFRERNREKGDIMRNDKSAESRKSPPAFVLPQFVWTAQK